MKTLIVLAVGLLAVGCGKKLTPEEKALRDSVVGEYELKFRNGDTYKQVFLENGVYEWYIDGKKQREEKWSIVDGEIHVDHGSGAINISRINPDKSITPIAKIRDGRRTDLPKEEQYTWKKIK